VGLKKQREEGRKRRKEKKKIAISGASESPLWYIIGMVEVFGKGRPKERLVEGKGKADNLPTWEVVKNKIPSGGQ